MPPPTVNTKTKPALHPHHYIRTPLAALFGFLAVFLIFASLFSIWLNRTLTDTPTFVNTVSPIIQTPEVQQFVAKQAAEQVLNSSSVQELSSQVLLPEQVAGKVDQQLRELLQTELENRIKTVIASDAFIRSWTYMTESTHAQLVTQLEQKSDKITLDFSPAVKQAIDLLAKESLKIDLGQASAELGTDVGKVTLDRSTIEPAAKVFDSLKMAVITFSILAVVCLVAAVWLSVHHMKTLRRMLLFTAVFAGILLLILYAPHIVTTSGMDETNKLAAVAVTDALFADLKTFLILTAVVGVVAAFGSKGIEILLKRRKAVK